MDVKVVESKKNKAVFGLDGIDHSIANTLRIELWNDSNVKIAGYNLGHPLVGQPTLVVETNTSETPEKALLEAIKRQKKVHDRIGKAILKEV